MAALQEKERVNQKMSNTFRLLTIMLLKIPKRGVNELKRKSYICSSNRDNKNAEEVIHRHEEERRTLKKQRPRFGIMTLIQPV